MKAIYTVAFAAVFVAFILDVKAVKCPAINEEDVTLIPNPDDCQTFYICNHGIPYLMECPTGLHFNVKERVCDNQEHAGCVRSTSTTSVPETSTAASTSSEVLATVLPSTETPESNVTASLN